MDRYGAHSVLVTSFSRTAAAELAGRDLPIDSDRIGTMHSHCFHALGAPEIAEANVEEWNRDNPQLALTPTKKHGRIDGEESVDDNLGSAKGGDFLLQELSRCRGRMLPPETWPAVVRQFAAKWQEYKQENGLLDFTDLIDTCYHDVYAAPKNPSVIFADEAQDLNRMQLSLLRKWGERAGYFIVVGDDDQTIFSFSGATPDAILDPDIPANHKIILKQSYRVPRAVHGMADKLIRQVTRRQEKIYLPRPEEGAVERLTIGGYKSPEYYILKTAEEHLANGKTIMFLGSCSYMLRPVVQVLRKHGIPFHNPYRNSNGFWNPIRLGKRGSTAERVLALLVAHPEYGEGHRPWTHADLIQWVELLASKGVLKHGIKAHLNAYPPEQQVAMDRLVEMFEPAALDSMTAAYDAGFRSLLQWWRERVVGDVTARVQYPADIVVRGGPKALLATPKVVVGTIHSVKGGQADVVFLFPDISQAAASQYHRTGAPRDAIIRLFYVGATRARQALYICQSEGAAIRLPN